MLLLRIFIVFSKISVLAFGGAYSFLPLIEHEVVENHHWLDKPEFLEIAGLTKLFPGAISIKYATYTGYKVAGIPGVIIANFANLLPPILLVMLISLIYSKYKDISFIKAGMEMIQYAVFAMIISIAFQLIDRQHIFEPKYLFVIVISFAMFSFTKTHPGLVILGAGLLGAIIR
ncbi:MAG: chromate transporter [Planctomycetota bacterium]|jgi:chromate transporter